MRITVVVACALLFGACTPENGPLMRPGEDCISCHGGGGSDDARTWTAAGTWTRGAHVSVTDANGKTVPMRGNKVGNFYTAESLVPPFTVSVDGVVMPALSVPLRYGGCNLCHVNTQAIDLELMAPGRDCLACHDGVAAQRFTVAGTWPGATSIVVRDRGGTGAPVSIPVANAVGNFHTTQSLVPPFRFSVQLPTGTKNMDPLAEHGSCNACHGSGGQAED